MLEKDNAKDFLEAGLELRKNRLKKRYNKAEKIEDMLDIAQEYADLPDEAKLKNDDS